MKLPAILRRLVGKDRRNLDARTVKTIAVVFCDDPPDKDWLKEQVPDILYFYLGDLLIRVRKENPNAVLSTDFIPSAQKAGNIQVDNAVMNSWSAFVMDRVIALKHPSRGAS